MALTVAVQMDPIERINIRGDSTFALLLEAQRRGHALRYYTPDRLVMLQGEVFATVQPLKVQDVAGAHFTPWNIRWFNGMNDGSPIGGRHQGRSRRAG